MRFTLLCLVATLILLTSSCSGPAFRDIAEILKEIGIDSLPNQEDYPEADAVYVIDNTDVQMHVESSYELYTYETVHVIKKLFKNIDDHASVQVRVYDGETLEDIRARTIKPDGSTHLLQPSDFHTITGESGGGIFYSDDRRVRFTFPAIERNCLVEYRYTKRKRYPFRYDVWHMQNYLPTLHNQYSLTLPTLLLDPPSRGGIGWKWRYMNYNMHLDKPIEYRHPNPERQKRTEMVTFTWHKKNVPAFEPEPRMPPHTDYLGYVKFAPWDWQTWNDISRWYYKELFEPQLVLSQRIKEYAQNLVANATTEEEKIRLAFDYARGLRYVAIELGIGGIRPNRPEKVMEREYGDCKDKSILLISLLKSMGIRAQPVLVLTKPSGSLSKEFASWNFNHMIVKASTRNGRVFWMDPTVQFAPLGQLPWQCEGINVLVINDDGTSQIESTPESSHNDNTSDLTITVTVSDKREATFNVTMKFMGQENLYMRSSMKDLTDKDIREFCRGLIVDEYVNASIHDYSFPGRDSVLTEFNLVFSFTVPNAVQQQADLYMLNTDPFKLTGGTGWLVKEKRKYPVRFNYPYRLKKRITILFPETIYAIRTIPENVRFSDNDFSYSATFSGKGTNSIVVDELFAVKSTLIPPQRYEELKRFYEKVAGKMGEKLILKRNAS